MQVEFLSRFNKDLDKIKQPKVKRAILRVIV